MQLEMINDLLHQVIVDKHGTDGWSRVRARIGQKMEEKANGSPTTDVTITDTSFADSLDFAREILIGASQELEKNGEDILQDFGRAAFMSSLKMSQGQILKSLGSSLFDYLNNLDNFVDIFVESHGLNNARTPSFRCVVNDDDQCLELHYYSRSHGWESCLIGAVICAAKTLFNQNVTMRLKQKVAAINCPCDDMSHSVFEIRSERKSFSVKKHVQSTEPHELNISVSTLCCTFPFHIVFDKNMEIQQLGVALLRLIGNSLKQRGTSMSAYFDLTRPDIKFTFDAILSRINGAFLLILKPISQPDKINGKMLMELKGQMIHLPESSCILYLASPLVKELEQLKGRGLFLSDIPIHDATRDLILVSEQAHAQDGLKKRMEQLQTELEDASNELEEEKKKTEDLLGSIFPQDVANNLIHKEPVPARLIENVTMLFSDIVGFTSICGRCTAMDIVEMLIDLYTDFDQLCEKQDLYKVETIGDAYVVAGGVQSLKGSAEDAYQVAIMALGMIECLENALTPEGLPLKMRVGIHTGTVLSGVVGTKMPRYCLFGHDVTLANKMETESEAGRINISPTTYQFIRQCNDLKFLPRYKCSLPEDVKNDQITGVCYFMERNTIYPVENGDGPLWRKLKPPARIVRRKPLHQATNDRTSKTVDLTVVKSVALKCNGVNGEAFLRDYSNGNLLKAIAITKNSATFLKSFKETSI